MLLRDPLLSTMSPDIDRVNLLPKSVVNELDAAIRGDVYPQDDSRYASIALLGMILFTDELHLLTVSSTIRGCLTAM